MKKLLYLMLCVLFANTAMAQVDLSNSEIRLSLIEKLNHPEAINGTSWIDISNPLLMHQFDCRPFLLDKAVQKAHQKLAAINFFEDLFTFGAIPNHKQNLIAQQATKKQFDLINAAHFWVGKEVRDASEWDNGMPLRYNLKKLVKDSFPKYIDRNSDAFVEYEEKIKHMLIGELESSLVKNISLNRKVTDQEIFQQIQVVVADMNSRPCEECFCKPLSERKKKKMGYDHHEVHQYYEYNSTSFILKEIERRVYNQIAKSLE